MSSRLLLFWLSSLLVSGTSVLFRSGIILELLSLGLGVSVSVGITLCFNSFFLLCFLSTMIIMIRSTTHPTQIPTIIKINQRGVESPEFPPDIGLIL